MSLIVLTVVECLAPLPRDPLDPAVDDILLERSFPVTGLRVMEIGSVLLGRKMCVRKVLFPLVSFSRMSSTKTTPVFSSRSRGRGMRMLVLPSDNGADRYLKVGFLLEGIRRAGKIGRLLPSNERPMSR